MAIVLDLRGHTDGQSVHVGVGGRWTELNVTASQAMYILPFEEGQCQPDQPLIVSIRTAGRVIDIDQQPWPVGVAIKEVRVE